MFPYEFYCLTPYEYWCKCEGYRAKEKEAAHQRRFLAYCIYTSAPRERYVTIYEFMPLEDDEALKTPDKEEINRMKELYKKMMNGKQPGGT